MDQTSELLVVRDSGTTDLPFTGPKKAGDVGYDLPVSAETVIPPAPRRGFFARLFRRPPAPSKPTDVPCGIRLKLPAGAWGMIVSRSSTHNRYPGLQLCSAPIDNGYTGPIDPRFRNVGDAPVIIPRGERLAQLVILPSVTPPIREVEELPETERGSTGIGST